MFPAPMTGDTKRLDEEVFAELCKGLTEEQKKELVRLADMILKNIDSE